MTVTNYAGKRVMIESPYRNGDRATNLRYLAWCEYDSAKRGEFPISSHGNCTQYWPEDDEHREMGFAWRDAYAQTCAFVAFYTDLGPLSEGAQKAAARDVLAGRATTVRTLTADDKAQFEAGEWPPGTMRKGPAATRLLSEAEDAALRRIRVKFMALHYQAKDSPTADAGELLEMQVARDALHAYGQTEPDPRFAMCDISLIAQEWAEQNPIGQGTSAPSFMRRICDVIGVTYGGDK